MEPQDKKELERLLAYKSDPDLALQQELADLADNTKDIVEALKGVPVREIEALSGQDGYSPVKGEDYFTDEEMRSMHEEIQANVLANMKGEMALVKDEMRLELSPIKGIDYTDGINGRDGIDGITPVKYADYFTEEDINEIVLSSVEYLEALEGDAKLDASAIKNLESNIDASKFNYDFLSIDYKQIKNAPKQEKNGTGGGAGARTVKWLNDIVNTDAATAGQALMKRSDGRFEFGDVSALPSMTGNNGKYLTTDGTDASWATLAGGGDMAAATYDAAGVSEQLVGLTAAQTLTNKTLTSPVLNTGVSGTAVLDEDNMASDSPTHLATQQSIKAYVDAGDVAPEGTAILSTGEVGGTKYLREDGDGTCSWQAIAGGGDLVSTNNLSDVADAATARTNLGVDVAGTDNSTDVTLGGTGTYITIAGQVITVDPITESDISDLGSYITGITGSPLSDLSDVTITTIASGEVLKWNGSAWINQTLAEAGIEPAKGVDDNFVTDAEKVVIGNTSGTNTGDEAAASLTVAGVVELATGAETNTGTDATRAVTPDGLDDWTGSAQITTLGTIGTGTWQGTAINQAYLEGQSGTNTGDDPGLENVVEDTTPELGGDLDANGKDIILGDATTHTSSILLNDSALADEKWSGTTIKGTAGETIAVGDLCYLKTADGEWYKTDGILDGTDTAFALKLGICVDASTDGAATEMLLDGVIASAAFPTLTVGAPVYMSDTAGDIVVAQPSTTNFAIRVLGYAVSATVLHFQPSNDYIVHV